MQEMISPKSSTKGPGRSKGQNTENSTPKRKQEQETEEVRVMVVQILCL